MADERYQNVSIFVPAQNLELSKHLLRYGKQSKALIDQNRGSAHALQPAAPYSIQFSVRAFPTLITDVATKFALSKCTVPENSC